MQPLAPFSDAPDEPRRALPSWARSALTGHALAVPVLVDRGLERWAAASPRARQLLRLGAGLVVVLALVWPRTHPWGPTTSLVVVSRDVAAGQRFSADDLEVLSWPVLLAPPDAVLDPADALGRAAAVALLAGSPLATSLLAAPSPADLAPPGWAAMAVPLDAIPELALGTILDLHGGDGNRVLGAIVLGQRDGHLWLALPRQHASALAAALSWGQLRVAVWSPRDHPA
ncbi:MAG: hypothetical protein ACI867_001044 [Glaciecola sp.]|jgi:hypothetical protein